MSRSVKITFLVIGLLALLLLVATGAVVVLTSSEFGRERVRRVVMGLLREKIRGGVVIDRIDGDLLGRFTLVNVRIGGENGDPPFLVANNISARLATRSLFSKKVLITDLAINAPVIRLLKRPGGEWNATRLLVKSDSTAKDSVPGFGDWVELRNVTVHDGTMIVQQPWTPDDKLQGAARDSAVRVALAGETRKRIDRAPWGLRETMDFRDIQGRFPTVVVAHPDSNVIALPNAQLSTVAAPFHPPVARVEELRGDVRIGKDTVTVANTLLRLPESRLTGLITYDIPSGDLLLALQGPRVAFNDLRVLYPPLPDSGGGTLNLDAAIRTTHPSTYAVTNAQLQQGRMRLVGKFGAIISDSSFAFRDTDVRLAGFPTRFVEALVPGFKLPPHTVGVVDGRAVLDGPLTRMAVNVDGRFAPSRHAPFHFAAKGGVSVGERTSFERLRARVDALPVAYVKEFAPSLPLGGTITADATVSGVPTARISGRFALTHSENDATSHIRGEGSVDVRGRMPTDATLHLDPVALATAQRFAPDTKLQGVVRGDATLRGTRDEMHVKLGLTLPEGRVESDGTFDLDAQSPSYVATVALHDVNVQAMAPSLPLTHINGDASVDGHGRDLATLQATVKGDFHELVVDSTSVQEVTLRAGAREGGLSVDSLGIRTPFATASAKGTVGLTEGREGKLTYRADISSLAGLERFIATNDTGSVPPRPGVRQRVEARQLRADSLREAARVDSMSIAAQLAAEQKRPRRGTRRRLERALPELATLPVDSTSGSIKIVGELTGQLQRFSTRGTAESGAGGIVWAGNAVGLAKANYVVEDLRTPNTKISGELALDSLRAKGFAFDSSRVKATYRNGEGSVELAIFPRDTSEYRANAEYVLRTGEGEVRLRDLSLRIDSTTWRTAHPAGLSWKGNGVTVDSLELRTISGGGRIFVNGEMPDVDPGHLEVAVDSLEIAPWLRLLESDVPATGVASLHGLIEGTTRNPRLKGDLSFVRAVYDSLPLPELRTAFQYDQKRLTMTGDLQRETGARLAQLAGNVPLDLSLGDSTVKTRLIDGPVTFDLKGDTIPLAPLAQLSGGSVTHLDGDAAGTVTVRGTYEKPQFGGDLAVRVRQATLPSTGITVRDGYTHLKMAGDSLVIDSLVAHSGGTITGGGIVQLATLSHPVLNVHVESHDARVLQNDLGELFADSRLTLRGPIDTMTVGGKVTITRGVVWIPDPELQDVISTGDPAIFAVVDTATARKLNIDVGGSQASRNLTVNVELSVARGTWARSRDANIEVYGDLGVRLTPPEQQLSLTGALYTDQGDYTFVGRRFVVSRGSVRFTGEPVLNPVLQVLANYEVRQAGRAPLDIRVVIGGTLKQPKLTLESDAQPTLSQSDLLSFLAFGVSSSSLLSFSGGSLSGGGQGGSSLAGNVAALAQKQLATIALDALVEEVKDELTEALRADRLNITPADVPASLTLGGLGTLLRGTELEIGKYVDRRTFLAAELRPTFSAAPGLYVERRIRNSFRLRTSYESRFLPNIPSLTEGLTPKTIQVIGATLRWTLAW